MRIDEIELEKNKWEFVVSDADKHEVGDELVRLVQHAYANTDQGSFVNAISDVLPSDWAVQDWDREPDVDVAVFYRLPRSGERWAGKKIQGLGHDGQQQSKAKAIELVADLLVQSGVWIEASDAMRAVLLKRSTVPVVTDESFLKKLYGTDELRMIDDNTYVRKLGNGASITETTFGKPTLS